MAEQLKVFDYHRSNCEGNFALYLVNNVFYINRLTL